MIQRQVSGTHWCDWRGATRLVAAAAMLALAAGPAAAQDCGDSSEGGLNTICGVVTADGQGIVGVTVGATSEDGAGYAITDASGFYAIAMGPGTYTVAIDTSTLPNTGTGSNVSPSSLTVVVASATDVHTNQNFVVTSAGVSGETVPTPCDFVTSGGFVIGDTGKKISFGAHGGCKNGEFWGHVNVVDHASGYHINSDEITGYVAPFGTSDPTRDVCGWASTNRSQDAQLVRFRVRLTDKGEPGSLDLFGIKLGAGAAAPYLITPRLLSSQKPGGGNVQLHKPNPSTTAPSPLPSDMCGGVSFEGGGPD